MARDTNFIYGGHTENVYIVYSAYCSYNNAMPVYSTEDKI